MNAREKFERRLKLNGVDHLKVRQEFAALELEMETRILNVELSQVVNSSEWSFERANRIVERIKSRRKYIEQLKKIIAIKA